MLFTLAFLAFSYIGYRTGRDYAESLAVRDTVRVTVFDTVVIRKPVVVDSVVIRYVTRKLRSADVKEDNFPNKGEEEYIPDSADMLVPIVQKIYRDTAYTAWVSGYMPSLDSIAIRQRTEHVTVTEKFSAKRKRWGIGIQAGYGVTAERNPQLSPYIGVGITYNLFNF